MIGKVETKPPAFVLLGRYGDIIQLLPAFMEIQKRIGHKPVVVTSTDYASTFDGVSYVRTHPISCEWWRGVPDAYRLACSLYGGGLVPQWWHLPKETAGVVEHPGGIILQSHGLDWGVDINLWPDYGTSMWDRAGFTRSEMVTLPLVFDRRNFTREQKLVEGYRRFATGKPMLLVNFSGQSSPFAPMPEVFRVVSEFSATFEIVDLGKVRADRIYDLLGFMDRAVGMVTIDTATMHLAPASQIPYVGYTVNGWCSSVPKGRCELEIKYNDAIARLDDLRKVLSRWKTSPPKVNLKKYVVSHSQLVS